VSAEEGGVTAQLDKILSMDGDVDVSQRKGKVITLFDIVLKIEYSGMGTVSVDTNSRMKYSSLNLHRQDER